MIRLTYLLRRKPGMSRAEFNEYWREVHGPLVAGHAHRLNMHRHVQVHTLEEGQIDHSIGSRGVMEEPYDGAEETWWKSRDGMAVALDSLSGRKAAQELLEDEAEFVDFPNSPLWFAHEYPQVNPSPENIIATERSSLVKFYYPLRHRANLSLQEAQIYWRTVHGPLIRALSEYGHTKRYIQVHRCEDELETVLRKARGTIVAPYTGHAEAWRDRAVLATENIPERVRADRIAVEDESKFIDFARSSRWLAKERLFVDYR